jgi:hypothetical protein
MNLEKLLASPSYPLVSGPVTNTPVTMTVTAPVSVDTTIYLAGFILSASAAPDAAKRVTITGPAAAPGSTALATVAVQIPAAAFAMLSRDWVTHPIKCVPGQNLVITIPALGSGVVGDATAFWFPGSP